MLSCCPSIGGIQLSDKYVRPQYRYSCCENCMIPMGKGLGEEILVIVKTEEGGGRRRGN
jgi:hypothetical protein